MSRRDEIAWSGESSEAGGVSRRRLFTGAGAAVLMANPVLLAACGSDDSSDDSSGKKTATTAAKVTPLGKQVNGFVGPGGAKAGQGKTFKLGTSLPLTGAGAFFGKEMQRGVALAVDHIKQAGGPDIQVTDKDHKTGNPNAGIQLVRELGQKKVGALLNSYLADFGAELPGLAAYKMLSIDPGGGTGQGFLEKPYFWGSRASWPDAPFEGIYKYVAKAKPEYKRVSLLIWDNGAGFVNPAKASLQKALASHGMQLVSVEKSPAGSTDFSTTVARLKSANPDVIQVAMSGSDVAYYLKAAAAGGLKAQSVGADWNPDTQKQAGGDADGFWFSFDYLDPKNPSNPWSKFYVEQFKKKYGVETTWLGANFYESTFVYWELIRRVIAKGGDINSGEALQSALEEDPNFKSVYGGDSSTVGTLAFDPQTHTIAKRDISLLQVQPSGDQKVLATFGIGGVDFKVV